ncbi:MAG: protein kinase, partial [Propionicimonas sp.]
MSPRPPAPPPLLPGFTHVRHLGSGGFADVYLYEETLLGRKVAVKVLLAGELMAAALENFTNEANLMAQLSNHPSIVSVYQAGVSDDGRPFIVMGYCSRPNLQARDRAGR